jgi:hypothetical protein
LAGDFFLGVDILVISMLVTFLLMALSVLALPARNPGIARDIRVLAAPGARVAVAGAGVVALGAFLAIHAWNDLSTAQPAWYYHSTYVWLVVMALASAVYRRELGKLRQRGVDVEAVFARLPPE